MLISRGCRAFKSHKNFKQNIYSHKHSKIINKLLQIFTQNYIAVTNSRRIYVPISIFCKFESLGINKLFMAKLINKLPRIVWLISTTQSNLCVSSLLLANYNVQYATIPKENAQSLE